MAYSCNPSTERLRYKDEFQASQPLYNKDLGLKQEKEKKCEQNASSQESDMDTISLIVLRRAETLLWDLQFQN